MAIEESLASLRQTLEGLATRLQDLQMTVIADRPLSDGGMIVDDSPPLDLAPAVVSLANGVVELVDEAQNGLTAVAGAIAGVRSSGNSGPVRSGLAEAQRSINRSLQIYLTDVAAFGIIHGLGEVSAIGGTAWSDWARAVQAGIDGSRDLMLRAVAENAECWQEMADKLAAGIAHAVIAGAAQPVEPSAITPDAPVEPIPASQLEPLKHSLSALANQTQVAYAALDSISLGPPERESAMLSLTGERAPITLAELLGWLQNFSATEGPRLLQGGHEGITSIRSIINRLAYLMFLAVQFSRSTPKPAERGIHSVRVQGILSDLLVALRQVVVEANRK